MVDKSWHGQQNLTWSTKGDMVDNNWQKVDKIWRGQQKLTSSTKFDKVDKSWQGW